MSNVNCKCKGDGTTTKQKWIGSFQTRKITSLINHALYKNCNSVSPLFVYDKMVNLFR